MFKVRLHLAKCSMKIFGKQRLVFRDFFQSSSQILCYIALGISRPTGLQIGLLLTGGVWKIVSCSIQRSRRIVTLAAVFYIAHSREKLFTFDDVSIVGKHVLNTGSLIFICTGNLSFSHIISLQQTPHASLCVAQFNVRFAITCI